MKRARYGVVIAMAALLAAAAPARADVKAQEKTQVKFEGMLGRMMNLFGGNKAKDGLVQTVIVKGDRKATLTDDTGTIVDLAEEKVYEVNFKNKSYKVVTFAEMRKEIEEQRRKAQEEARKNEDREKKDPNRKEMQVSFDIKETGQKKEINGYACRQIITTIGVHEKGKTLEQAGGILMTVDSWMAPTIAAMKEVADFDLRYAQKLATEPSARDLAQAMAMFPGLQEAMEKFKKEKVNMQGTPIQSVMTFQSVMTPEQAAQAKQRDEESPRGGALGGMLGRFGRKKADDTKSSDAAPTAASSPGKTTIMTSTNDLLSVATSVTPADLQVPAGFKQK